MAERKWVGKRVHNYKYGARGGFTGKNTFERRPGGDDSYRGTWGRAPQVEACAKSHCAWRKDPA